MAAGESMTPSLADLRRIAEAATPGPWRWGTHGVDFLVGADRKVALAGDIRIEQPDAQYIATFNPQTVLALLDRLQAAEKVVECGRNVRHWEREAAHAQMMSEYPRRVQADAEAIKANHFYVNALAAFDAVAGEKDK